MWEPPRFPHPLLVERSLLYLHDYGLPKSKLVEDIIVEQSGYHAAPLDMVSMVNGVLKFEHSFGCMNRSEYFLVKQWLCYMYGGVIAGEMWSVQRAVDELDKDKACGCPYNLLYGSLKGDVLENMSGQDLLDDFAAYSQLTVATLKDELREMSKDARVFVPANICMVTAGNFLFGGQNLRIQLSHNDGPIKIGLSTPGVEAYELWNGMYHLSGRCIQADGAQNDAHFAPIIACLIRDFRKEFLPKEYHKWVDLYYDMTYNILCNVRGCLLNFYGQPSGQTNTSMDNSLATLILCMLHAIRRGMTYQDFSCIFFAIMGDDLMLRDPFGVFTPEGMNETWNSVGMFIEIPAQFEEFWDMTFIGMHPVRRDDKILYSYNSDRMMASMNFARRNASPEMRLQKLISLAHLVFAQTNVYNIARSVCFQYATDNRAAISRAGLESLGSLTELHQLNMYCNFEPSQC